MARGRKTSLTISLTVEEPQTLMAWQRFTTIRAGCAKRGRVILLIADRVPLSHIATISGVISPLTPTSQRAGTRRGVLVLPLCSGSASSKSTGLEHSILEKNGILQIYHIFSAGQFIPYAP